MRTFFTIEDGKLTAKVTIENGEQLMKILEAAAGGGSRVAPRPHGQCPRGILFSSVRRMGRRSRR